MASGDTLELLRSAQAALEADAAALEARRVSLAAERESLEAEKSRMTRMAAATAESDVVTLNVGGRRVCAQRRVFTAARDSLLGAMLSGRWDGSLARDADGVIFLDADPDSFAQLLAALRMCAAPAAGSNPRGGCHPPLRCDLVALADEYLLRDYLWPAPAAGADVVQAGAAVCAVTVEHEGRALRVRGGQQLPQPVTLQAPAPAAGFAFGAGAQPAPFGGFGAPAAPAAPVFGAAGVPTPQSVLRQDLAEYVRLGGNLALGPWPAAYRVPWSAQLAVPFNSEENDNLNHAFAVGIPNRVNAQFDIINRGGRGQHGQVPQGPCDLTVPLSNYVLCSPPLLICSDAVTCASFVLSLRSLTGGAVVGVARDARCVYGLMLLRRLAPWHIPASATLNGHPQSSRGTFLPVVNGKLAPPTVELQPLRAAASLRFDLLPLPGGAPGTRVLRVSQLPHDGDEAGATGEGAAVMPPLLLPPLGNGETEAPWRIYVQPMPDDEVIVQHAVDALFPAPEHAE